MSTGEQWVQWLVTYSHSHTRVIKLTCRLNTRGTTGKVVTLNCFRLRRTELPAAAAAASVRVFMLQYHVTMLYNVKRQIS